MLSPWRERLLAALGEFARQAKDLGANFIGGCCGCLGSHMREMAIALGKYKEDRIWKAAPDTPMSETEFNWERRQA